LENTEAITSRFDIEMLVTKDNLLVGAIITRIERDDEEADEDGFPGSERWYFVDVRTLENLIETGEVSDFTRVPLVVGEGFVLFPSPREEEIEYYDAEGVGSAETLVRYACLPRVSPESIAGMMSDSNKAVAIFEQDDSTFGIVLMHGDALRAVRKSTENIGCFDGAEIIIAASDETRTYSVDGLSTGFVRLFAYSWKDICSTLESLEKLGVEIIIDHVRTEIRDPGLAMSIISGSKE
jgi:hypothetical protein